MDHVSPDHTRLHLADVARAALCAKDITNPDKFRGVVVVELHADGTFHLHGCFTVDWYLAISSIIEKARAADEEIRGWRVLPEVTHKRFRRAGVSEPRFVVCQVRMPNTGTKWHLNVATAHVYAPESAEVQKGKKRPNEFKSSWKFNDMVAYLLAPSKEKTVDATPLFVNCDPDTIFLDPELCQPHSLLDLTRTARLLKRNSISADDALEELVLRSGSETKHMQHLQVALKAYGLQSIAQIVHFLPIALASGALDSARPFQRWVCQYLETSFVGEANGLWITGPPGFGKTTLMKLFLIRYPGVVCFAQLRGSTSVYDRNVLMHYDQTRHRILIFNDVKPAGHLQVWPDPFLALLREVTDGLR